MSTKTPCPMCKEELKKPKKEKIFYDYKQMFIDKLESKYPNRFSYENLIYKNREEKIKLFDKILNEEIETTGDSILTAKKLEHVVGYESTKLLTYNFIEKARKIHGDRYDYSKTKYIHSKKKVCIICHEKNENEDEHGEFWQTPNEHLKGHGCGLCAKNIKWSQEQFIEEAVKIHGNKYDYSKVKYTNTNNRVTLICPEHGEFKIRPCNHLQGSGCSKCNGSGGEKALLKLFEDKQVFPQYNKRYKWLNNYQLDFYFPEYKLAIEVQGEQHFKDTFKLGNFESQQRRDKEKAEMCKKYGITLLYFATFKMNFPYEVFTDINHLWKEIETHF